MSAINVDESNFQSNVLDVSGKPVLIDFWAPWCGPCQMQGPIVDDVAEEVGDKAVVGKINVDEAQSLAAKYGVMSIPSLKVFKDGVVVEEMVGVHQKTDLLSLIEKHS